MTAAMAKTFKENMPADATALPWLKDTAQLNVEKTPAWMSAQRATGAAVFAEQGMPTPAREGWQYTNLRSLTPEKFIYAPVAPAVGHDALPEKLTADSYRIVLVNGQYRADLSDTPKHVEITTLANASQDAADLLVTVGDLSEYPLLALNAAHMRDGIVLKTAAHKDIDKPVEVLFWTAGNAASYPRVLYWAGENSGVTIYERHAGAGDYFANSYAAIELSAASRFRFYRFVEESKGACHISHARLRQAKGASFEGFSLATGGGIVRQELRMQLIDQGISASIGGIYLLKEDQSHDFTIQADHFEPDGTSIQHFKGVIDDKARAVFQGKIYVHRPAQKTDGYQSHHALLLSERAEANAKPELEIYADDVKCSHGATAGRLDVEALFYLQSRGIPFAEARALLIHSFLIENLERLTSDAVRDIYAARIEAWLEGNPV